MGWELFFKYVGIQGVLAFAMTAAWIASQYTSAALTESFEAVMLIIIGFYFGRNGGSLKTKVAQKLIGKTPKR